MEDGDSNFYHLNLLIQLRDARQEIEHIEGELKKNSVVSSGELRVKIDRVIGAVCTARAILQEGAKNENEQNI